MRSALVVDDDDELRVMLAKLLADAGYEVHTASGGRAGAASAIATPPDVVLLDLSMPDIDGWRALEMIREHGPLPAVVVLSSFSRESDKVRALHLGADDYVTKPFSSPELLARVGSAARRSSALRGGIYPATLSFDGIEIDLDRRDATLDGHAISLTKSEYDLLVMLVAEPNRVFTRRQLVDRLWGPDWFGDEHTIDMHVSRLRGKLGDDVRAPRFIQTVRGVGFRIAPAADGPTPGQKSGIRPEDRTEPT